MIRNLKKKNVSFSIKAISTILLLILIAASLDVETLWFRLSSVSIGWACFGFAMFLIQVVFNAIRWSYILKYVDRPLHFLQAFRIYLESMFFNQALPATIGGDAVRLYQIIRLGHAPERAATSIILDRIFGFTSLIIFIVLAQIPFYNMVIDFTYRITFSMLPIFGVLVIVTLCVLPFALPSSHDGNFLSRVLFHTKPALQSLFRQPRLILPSLALSLAGVAAMLTGAWALAVGADATASGAAIVAVVPAAILVSMIPISVAGWGVREGTIAAGFTLIGANPADGVALSVLIGLTLLAIGLVGGAFWALSDFFGNEASGDATQNTRTQ